MKETSRSRLLWLGLLAPPFLLLIGAGALTLWPQHLLGVMDVVSRVWTPSPAGPRRAIRTMPSQQPAPPQEIRGTIRKPDGSPYTGLFRLSNQQSIRRAFRRFIPPVEARGPEFLALKDDFRWWLVIDADDYPPTAVSPLEIQNQTQRSEDLVIDLQKGFPHRIRVVDAEGVPIAGAAVRPSLTLDDRPVPVGEALLTDDDGWALLPHAANAEYEFEVNVYDCAIADDTIFSQLVPGVDTQIQLDRSSMQGVAVDESGTPAADALILIAAEFDARLDRSSSNPFHRVVVARSDAEGRFPLPHLHHDSVYLLQAEGRDGSLGYAPNVRLGGREPRITLHPQRMVKGRVKGDRRGVSASLDRTIPVSVSDQQPGLNEYDVRRSTIPLTVDADGRFEYPTWQPGDAELKVAGQPVSIPWPPPTEPIELSPSLEPPFERTVQLRLTRAEGLGPIEGAMTVFLMNGPAERTLQSIPRRLEIQNDQADLFCLSTERFRYESTAIPGYWIVPGIVNPAGGPGDRFISIRVMSPGTLQGKVVDSHDKPVSSGVKVHAEWDQPPLPNAHGQPLSMRPPVVDESAEVVPRFDPVSTDEHGRFLFPSLPVPFAPLISVERGRFRSRPVRVPVEPLNASHDRVLRIPQTARAEVRLVDAERRPIPGVMIQVTLEYPGQPRWAWPAGPTDADGRIVLDDLATGIVDYRVDVDCPKDFLRTSAALKPNGPPLELVVERGKVLEGTVVESVTGWPIPDVKVTALSRSGEVIDAEAASDDQGRFRISKLPEGIVRLDVGEQVVWKFSPSVQPSEVTVGEGPVTLRLSNLREIAPRPRPPSRP